MLTISLLEREKYVLRKDTHSGKNKKQQQKNPKTKTNKTTRKAQK